MRADPRRLARVAFKRQIVVNALGVALVVGTVLNLVNQGAELWSGRGIAWGQVCLNFLVPYCVATYSAARNELRQCSR